jgi:preprotein translocase subunit SecY
VGVHIPVPGLTIEEIDAWRQRMGGGTLAELWELLLIFSAGAFDNISLLSMGIMPFITASIIMQLMTKVHPKLEELSKEGPAGYRKINQYTRLLTVPICVVQSFMATNFLFGPGGLSYHFGGFFGKIFFVMTLTTGAIFVMWLAEQITEHGIGNGASILITVGIVARLPSLYAKMIRETGNPAGFVNTEKLVFMTLFYLVAIVGIVLITQAQRRIPVQSAKFFRGRRVYSHTRNFLPLRVNTAGVMPVIFAGAMMIIPSIIAQIIPGASAWLTRGGFFYVSFYIVLIVFFSYFWTYLFYQPNELAKNLKEYGSFIPGIRPGGATAEYLNFILSRITICGAAFLCLIALLPDALDVFLRVGPAYLAFLGGTSILISVSVSIDVAQKIESYLLMHHYSGFIKGAPIRGRR